MKRLFVAIALAGVTMFALAGTASADVPRYQFQTATFDVTQPAGTVSQWSSVWTHEVTIAINPCDQTFTGTAIQYDPSMVQAYTETVTGSLGTGMISINFVRNDGVEWSLTNALYAPVVNIASSIPPVSWVLEAKVTTPVITVASDWKNHGQYVKAQGGGDDAAHSCIGMPIPEVPFTWSRNGIVDSTSMTGTNVALPMAGTYRIDVIGDWRGNSDAVNMVDAEYVTGNSWTTWSNGPAGYGEGQGDLQVNGAFVDWGAYSPVHAYTMAMPLSGAVNLAVFDGDANANAKNASWYTDNYGTLSFTITYVGP